MPWELPEQTSSFLSLEFFGNSVQAYLIALGLLIAFLIVFKIIQTIILRRLADLAEKTTTDIDNTLIDIVRRIRPGFYSFLALFLAVKSLILPALLIMIINWILIIWVTYQAIIALQILIDYAFRKKMSEESGNTEQALRTLSIISKGVLWVVGILFILSNMGVNVTSAMAGLGIGGIAIALALQNILGDLFSSFAIYFDKPFEIGDFIVVGDKVGTVEKIGIKTTRLRALQGEEIVMANKELTSAQIQNFKKMAERRVVFHFGVTYGTETAKLKKIPAMIKEIFGQLSQARLDRAHFSRFDDSALTYEVVYYTNSADYDLYMDTQQEINLSLKDAFDEASISLAFPTRTIHLIKD
ncbi:MAG: mechanosensitive ion channel family protein [Candidatus Paceibacterota bacterium]